MDMEHHDMKIQFCNNDIFFKGAVVVVW